MIKMAIKRDKDENVVNLIESNFTSKSFEVFCNLVDFCPAIKEESQIKSIIKDRLLDDKSGNAKEAVEKFIPFF